MEYLILNKKTYVLGEKTHSQTRIFQIPTQTLFLKNPSAVSPKKTIFHKGAIKKKRRIKAHMAGNIIRLRISKEPSLTLSGKRSHRKLSSTSKKHENLKENTSFGSFGVPGAALWVPGERLRPWGWKKGRGTEFFERTFGRLWVPGASIGSPLGSLGAQFGDLLA